MGIATPISRHCVVLGLRQVSDAALRDWSVQASLVS